MHRNGDMDGHDILRTGSHGVRVFLSAKPSICFLQCLVLLQLISGCLSFIGDMGERPKPLSLQCKSSNLYSSASQSIEAKRETKCISLRLRAGTTYEADTTRAQGGELVTKKRHFLDLLKNNKLLGAYQMICDMVAAAGEIENKEDLHQVSSEIDQILQTFTSRAFLAPYKGQNARRRIMLGLDALALQLSSALVPPYNTVPKRVFLDALRALTVMNESQQPAVNRGNTTLAFGLDSSYSAFRILQRLVSGVGIRRKAAGSKTYNNGNLQEKDFNMVLNSFSNIGRMDMAHKIVALQERTENAPPLSPVAYSILLKGYGRLGDLRNVDMILTHAKANKIVPDTIMLNSLIDAYVNCRATGKARSLFNCMTNKTDGTYFSKNTLQWMQGDGSIPKANRRTYNTILKGLAQTGSLNECLSLSKEMQELRVWDTVTTNTLVHAAVIKQNFTLAEAILNRYTATPTSSKGNENRNGRHPNVEAYTELLDGYSKAGELNKALRVMQTMNGRGVDPTEVTYTCLMAAFARQGKVDKARKTMDYMTRNAGMKPSAVTYNVFISALLSAAEQGPELRVSLGNNFPAAESTDEQVDEALRVFYSMMKAGIPPNDVTVSTIVLGLGRCRPVSRVAEAKALVSKLENNGIIHYANSEKVATALVQACGYGYDMQGARESFQKLKRPDSMAVNTFLGACCRCDNVQTAMKTFRHFFAEKEATGNATSASPSLVPDVITYSILTCALLVKDTAESSKEAQDLYESMKSVHNIFPDKAMVDQVLKTIVRSGKLQKKDIHLVASVVRDAEALNWRPNQLERRKRAIQEVLSSRSGILNSWGEDDDILRQEVKSEDALFKQKGWNSVDSGFRLWGGGRMDIKLEDEGNDAGVDKFLESKGWNNVDSGFRII